jgi:hypothetical protein
MERASVYRRALAPVAITVGVLGLAAAGLAQAVGWAGPSRFAVYWLGVAVLAMLSALLLIRRQALQGGEEFWSPPTRRVAQAMAPLLVAGLGLGLLEMMSAPGERDSIRLIALWMVLYGGALHAAGFFMRRGLKLMGWIYVIIGCLSVLLHELELIPFLNENNAQWYANWLMGFGFGANNLAYGLYLKLTTEPLEAE